MISLPGGAPCWLFTCRHTYEDVLVAQLLDLPEVTGATRLSDGLVAALVGEGAEGAPVDALLRALDPTYALQVLPNVREVEAAGVNTLGKLVSDVLADPVDGVSAPWDLHVLVPAQLKGNPRPPMARRAMLLEQAIAARLGKIRKRAWRQREEGCGKPARLAQVLLLDHERAAVSCVAPVATEVGGTWPVGLPAGHAEIPRDDGAPASSFRKLEEALLCLRRWPQQGERAVDVGACPGGWTRVLRRNGANVDAVDRQPLVQHLMRDRRVHFHKADAFTWEPEGPVDWWVSDVIAFPERILGMVERVANEVRPRFAVIQMKFRREPDHDAVAQALATLRAAGYGARARHFFNDKNEMTLMAVRDPDAAA